MFNAKTINDFISKDDAAYIISVAIKSDLWSDAGSQFWDGRAINYHIIKDFDKKAGDIILESNIRCGQFIKSEYKLSSEIYPDLIQIIRWFPGMSQPPHSDDMTDTDIKGFSHRAFGSIIYLNNDYEGGQTYYPNFNFFIKPEPGMLAVHPGNPEHLHGVTEVKNNTRYTIASFWTFNQEGRNAKLLY